jgi:hypothetical protein
LTCCSNDHQICCRVHKAEPIADGPSVGHWWCNSGGFNWDFAGTSSFLLHPW